MAQVSETARSSSPEAPRDTRTALERCLQPFRDEFLTILHEFLDPVEDWSTDLIRRGTIRLVCRGWKETLDETPTMWARLFFSAHMTPEYVQRLFYNARNTRKTVIVSIMTFSVVPVDVNPYPHHLEGPIRNNGNFLMSIVEQLSLYRTSISKLSVRVSDLLAWNAFVLLLDGVSFPALKALAAMYKPSGFNLLGPPPRPFPVPATLKQLFLDNIPPNCVSGYTNITFLALSGSVFPYGTNVGLAVLDVVQHCTRLRSLHLVDVDYEDNELEGGVNLPHLQNLAFTCGNLPRAGSHMCGKLVQCLDTPLLSTLSLHFAHRRGANQFCALNRVKLAQARIVELSGRWMTYAGPLGGNIVSLLRGAEELDIRRISRVPSLAAGTTQGIQQVESQEYKEFLGIAMALPNLHFLRVPRSISAPKIDRPCILQVHQLFLESPRAESIRIVEEHATCVSRVHVMCGEYRAHICGPDSLPHENCIHIVHNVEECLIPSKARLWRCTDLTHSTCARVWEHDGFYSTLSATPRRTHYTFARLAYEYLFFTQS